MAATAPIDNIDSLKEAALAAFYQRQKGGVVVTSGGNESKYLFAFEFDGPSGNGGAIGEMVFIDKNPAARAVAQQRGCPVKVLGENFLMGETVEHIEASEDALLGLIRSIKRNANSRGLIDLKSGLKLYEDVLLLK